ncbi:MAG: hypothetical protein ABII00_05550 [Elusimicrobiota bacterium]
MIIPSRRAYRITPKIIFRFAMAVVSIARDIAVRSQDAGMRRADRHAHSISSSIILPFRVPDPTAIDIAVRF